MQKSIKKGTDEVKLVSSEAMRLRDFRKRKADEGEMAEFIANMSGIVTQEAIKSAKDCVIPPYMTDFCTEKSVEILIALGVMVKENKEQQKGFVESRKLV